MECTYEDRNRNHACCYDGGDNRGNRLRERAWNGYYKAKYQNCHGTDGRANSGAGKILEVEPATDPSVKKMSEAEMIVAVRSGMGKMQPYKNTLTDAQIKAPVDYLQTLVK